MKITVMNFKGGVGKTSLACNFALMMNCAIVTNDYYSSLQRLMPPSRVMKLEENQSMPQFPKHVPIVFDFGGYIDKRMDNALKQSDVVVIPTFTDINSLRTTNICIAEVMGSNSQIVVVANKCDDKGEALVQAAIDTAFPDNTFPLFRINASKIFENCFKYKKSIRQLADIEELPPAQKVMARSYERVYLQYLELSAFLKKVCDNNNK